MVAGIDGAGHDGAGGAGNRVIRGDTGGRWRWRGCRRRRRCWAAAVTHFQAIRERCRETRERRGRAGAGCLHAASFTVAVVGGCTIDHVKA